MATDKKEEKVEKVEKKSIENIKEKINKKMYIGPSMRGMFTGTIYEDIDSEPLKSLRIEYPEINTLLVDIDENISKKKIQAKEKGNIYNAKYKELEKKLNEKRG